MLNFIQRQLLLLKYNKLPVLPKKTTLQKIKEYYHNFDILDYISLKGLSYSAIDSEYCPERARFEKLSRISRIHESKIMEKFFQFEKDRIDQAIELNKKIFDDFDAKEEDQLRSKLMNKGQHF